MFTIQYYGISYLYKSAAIFIITKFISSFLNDKINSEYELWWAVIVIKVWRFFFEKNPNTMSTKWNLIDSKHQ